MSERREVGLKGTGEQIVNGQITWFLFFFLSPNLFLILFYVGF